MRSRSVLRLLIMWGMATLSTPWLSDTASAPSITPQVDHQWDVPCSCCMATCPESATMRIHRRHDGERRTVDRQALSLSRTGKSIALTLLAGRNGPWPGRLYRSYVWKRKG